MLDYEKLQRANRSSNILRKKPIFWPIFSYACFVVGLFSIFYNQGWLASALGPTPVVLAASTSTKCARSGNYSPAPVDLDTAPSGLSINSQSVSYYKIHGNTAAQLEAAVSKCSPSYGYAGQTSYQMNWSISQQPTQGGQCDASDVKVNLSVVTVLPGWQDENNSSALGKKWASFSAALAKHESGHRQIDEKYALLLLNDLKGIKQTSCSDITSRAEVIASSALASLDQANNNYDSATDHGATQGAVIP